MSPIEDDRLQATIALCHRAGAEPLPEDFSRSLHQALVAAGAPKKPFFAALRARLQGSPFAFAAAAAALAAVMSAGGTLTWVHAKKGGREVAYRVPEAKVALVKIDFVASKNIDDVAFEITLPDGLRFVSGGQMLAERSFRFVGRLAAGDNSIPVAVKGPHTGRYKVIAHAIGSELDVTQEVVLEVTS
jgi:hypothetical protein